MANQACIAIGINQYQFFQPLGYAQADAQAVWQFLVEEAGWPQDRCLLLTDTSPPTGARSTIPTKENILGVVENFGYESVMAGDLLWVFFSGYGVTLEGEDYLMPIDGNPASIPETGIPVRSLFEPIKDRGASPVLVFLDINRSQSAQVGVAVGAQTVDLATKLGISTILSCQLDQFSHEAASLGHGLFTVGLLEALRENSQITLASLETALRDRVPSLSEHHWQPIQTPLIVASSPEASEQLILYPPHNIEEVNNGENPFIYQADAVGDSAAGTNNSHPSSVLIAEAPQTSNRTIAVTNGQQPTNPNNQSGETEPKPPASVPPAAETKPAPEPDDTPTWTETLVWAGGAALLILLMIGGVFLRNQEAFIGGLKPQPGANRTAVNKASTTTAKEDKKPQASSEAKKPTKQVGASTLQAVKPSKQTTTKATSVASKPPAAQNKAAGQANKSALDKARSLIKPNQASGYSQAIVIAQKIPSKDPQYNQAKKEIDGWSQKILDIANARAKQGNYTEAVSAAQLVPTNVNVSGKAKDAIQDWKEQANQQRTNQTVLRAAKGLIRPNQASSYSDAIATASKIQQGEAGYGEAQKVMGEWSKTIYQLAQSRASKGQFKEAIQTASLVPENTTSYQESQKAIALWKGKTKK